MGQRGFFDFDKRMAALSEKGDPLEAINALVPWETFRSSIEAVALTLMQVHHIEGQLVADIVAKRF